MERKRSTRVREYLDHFCELSSRWKALTYCRLPVCADFFFVSVFFSPPPAPSPLKKTMTTARALVAPVPRATYSISEANQEMSRRPNTQNAYQTTQFLWGVGFGGGILGEGWLSPTGVTVAENRCPGCWWTWRVCSGTASPWTKSRRAAGSWTTVVSSRRPTERDVAAASLFPRHTHVCVCLLSDLCLYVCSMCFNVCACVSCMVWRFVSQTLDPAPLPPTTKGFSCAVPVETLALFLLSCVGKCDTGLLAQDKQWCNFSTVRMTLKPKLCLVACSPCW